MDLVSDLEWLYRQDLVKIHHGQLPFLGLWPGATASLQALYRDHVKTACFSRGASDSCAVVFQNENCSLKSELRRS